MASVAAIGSTTVDKNPGAQTGERTASESRVDRDSHFNGLFETKQNLRIEGVAEGEIQCQGTVTVAEGASVKAKVTANTVTIAGELQGEVVCRDVFQILPTGLVEATVSARRLIVQEGGFYNGEFHMIGNTPASSGAAGTAKGGSSKAAAASDRLTTDEWWSQLTSGSSTDDAGKGKASGEEDGKKKAGGDAPA